MESNNLKILDFSQKVRNTLQLQLKVGMLTLLSRHTTVPQQLSHIHYIGRHSLYIYNNICRWGWPGYNIRLILDWWQQNGNYQPLLCWARDQTVQHSIQPQAQRPILKQPIYSGGGRYKYYKTQLIAFMWSQRLPTRLSDPTAQAVY